MDIATIVGLIAGSLLIGIAIVLGGNPVAFIDIQSILIVIGGSTAAVLICYPLKQVFGIGGIVKNVFLNTPPDLAGLIEQLVSLAETARRDGLLALEGRIDEIEEPFIILGIQMAVDGTRPEVIEDIMRTEMESVETRHKDGKSMVDQLGRFAPAFGMIGTLIGLIIMLGDLDPEKVGTGMAVSLLTTLYGAIMANLFYLPFAEKLGLYSKKELLAMEIITRGVMAIQSGENPRVVEQKLSTFIPPKMRTNEVEDEAGE